MERRGGCCLARVEGGASMAWQMGRIMLKYRPIAPKPAAVAPPPPPAAAAAPAATVGGTGRGKRKAASGAGGKRGRKPKKPATEPATVVPKASEEKEKSSSSPSSSSSGMTSVDSSPPATLLLLPSPEEKEKPVMAPAPEPPPQVVAPRPLRPAASWVTVEGVTDTWRDGEAGPSVTGAGETEAPGFVSDQSGRVTWTNKAFNRMVAGAEDDAAADVHVGLAESRGAAVPAWGTCAGFTCRVRVRYACPQRGRGALAAPCDVWRLDNGAYAWRLDVQTALSLGLH